MIGSYIEDFGDYARVIIQGENTDFAILGLRWIATFAAEELGYQDKAREVMVYRWTAQGWNVLADETGLIIEVNKEVNA